ncbi:MAG: serine/threonine protein kinase [Planctomycetes bacterium]|nr:serine/threonine protein kinase [Planctomycetota bacterium]
MSISLDEFVKSLTETGILSADELSNLLASLPADQSKVDVEKVARDLIRQGKMTKFQASVIFRRQSRGLKIGKYLVLDKIGSGGMGQVFKAEDRRARKRVALKLLRATYTKSERAVTRFYREANTAARLRHKNLVSVSEAGEWNGLHYLVMELIEGRDVRSIVKEKGPFSVKAALDIVVQAARGLAYAHEHGIIHRDMKPANLLLEKSGRVVILDLGLARLDESAQEAAGDDQGRLTMPGHFLGTLDFVAPEQARDAHEIDGRSDIYSLGCTLYYLLTGGPPFRRESAALILMAHCVDAIPELTQVAGVTARLNAVYVQMMAKKCTDRFASMTDVVTELELCQRELEGHAVPPVMVRKSEVPAPVALVAEPVDSAASSLASSETATDPTAATIEFPEISSDPGEFPPAPAPVSVSTERGQKSLSTLLPGSKSMIDFVDSSMSDPFESIGDMMKDKAGVGGRGMKFWLVIAGGAIAAMTLGALLSMMWGK